MLLEELNRFHEALEGSMPAASVGKYALYMYIGALLNTALVWLTQDVETSPEAIAAFFLEHVRRMMDANRPPEGGSGHRGED